MTKAPALTGTVRLKLFGPVTSRTFTKPLDERGRFVVPTLARKGGRREPHPQNSSARVGLTSRQTWTLHHIVRCGACGSWQVVTDQVLASISSGVYEYPAICDHFRVGE